MRQHGYCMKCNCRKLWIINQAIQALDEGNYKIRALPVARFLDKWGFFELGGKFEVLICANPACGYTEWHAYDLNGLTELAKDPKSGVRLISSEPDSPYR